MATPSVASHEQSPSLVRVTRTVERDRVPIERWTHRLESGDPEGAWSLFLDTYRELIFATIVRLVRDAEERMDVFALVCERLREDDFRRLRAFEPEGPARFSTWLVTVTRNIAVDWHRSTRGRRRVTALESRLSPVQQTIMRRLTGSGMSYVEAYESMRSSGSFGGPFAAFLREVRDLYREVLAAAGPLARELVGSDPSVELAVGPDLPEVEAEDHQRVFVALESLPEDVQAATLLFVVDGVPADQVARIVGWPNRKAVYNRVHRALLALRKRLSEKTR